MVGVGNSSIGTSIGGVVGGAGAPSNHGVTNTAATMNENAASSSSVMPKDCQVIKAILKQMNVEQYDPRIVPQLVELAYSNVSQLLEESLLYSLFSKKSTIDSDDAAMAIQVQYDNQFVGPPSRSELLEIAQSKNNQPLPAIKSHNGMRLPADRFSLVAANVRYNDDKKNDSKVGLNTPVSTFSSSLASFSRMSTPGLKRPFDEI